MSADTQDPVDELVEKVQHWTPEQRYALIQRLQQAEEQRDNLVERHPANLIGLIKVDNPPSDEDVKRIIHEVRMRKYG